MPVYVLGDKAPRIAASAWIAPSADVIGEVVLGEEASVWFGAVIRADNGLISVGDRSNVQDGATLHSDPDAPLTIGRGVTIGHRAILHGCTVEDDVLVGMGATILNHAVIGAGSIVGAGALVTEGKIFPPCSLIVGAPATVRRTLDPAAIDGLRRGADGYAAKARHFREELRPA